MKTEKFGAFTDGFYETGNQVHGWIKRRADEYFEAEKQRKENLRTGEDVRNHQQKKRRLFFDSIGGLPQRQTPIETVETGRLERDGYTIKKIVYQSMPSVYVAGNLYLPRSITPPAPGVFMGCGHTREGKAAPIYQKVCIDLVRAGFIVLIIDSPSHGEMLQCLDPETGDPTVGWTTREHSHMQLSASVIGYNIMRYFVWNAMRGIDLLCDLPEVDSTRIGVTGNSGGGHLTQALMMSDPRVAAAMSCCSQTTRASYLDTGIRAYDGEQNLFGCIPRGLDYDDFLSAIAPRPVRIGAAEYDYFAIEGVMETYGRVKKLYQICGAGENVDLCLAKGEKHAYSAPLRRGCVEWFGRHLLGQNLDPAYSDPDTEPPETLQCTETGQVMSEYGDARSILDLNREVWENLRRSDSKANLTQQQLCKRLRFPKKPITLRPRVTAKNEMDRCTGEHVFFFSEPDITVTAVLYRPLETAGATLLLIPGGTEGQGPYVGKISSLIAEERLVMVFDPRGTGAVRMRSRNTGEGYEFRSTEFRVANDHFMLGTSLASRRAFDVLRALEFLRTRYGFSGQGEIDLIAHGAPSLWGLTAAAVDGDMGNCSFSGLPDTWAEAFTNCPPARERISESFILPELEGAFDVPWLRKHVSG